MGRPDAGPWRVGPGESLTMNPILRIGLALGLFLFPALPTEAAQKYCEAEVNERLDRLNVSPSNIGGF